MKLYTLFAFILFNGIIYAQKQFDLEYEMILNLKTNKRFNATLKYDGNKSYFHWNNTKIKEDETSQTDDFGNLKFEIILRDSVGSINYIDFKAQKMITRELRFKTPIILKEKLPKIKWELENEEKKIGSFTCNKATAKFRGRNYIAWYTTDLPMPIGPWKLQGLPGTIVQAFDDTNTVQFFLTSVKTKNTAEDNYNYDKIFTTGEVYTLKEYEIKQNNLVNDLIKKIKSKLPRGASISIDGTTQNFLEKEFETYE